MFKTENRLKIAIGNEVEIDNFYQNRLSCVRGMDKIIILAILRNLEKSFIALSAIIKTFHYNRTPNEISNWLHEADLSRYNSNYHPLIPNETRTDLDIPQHLEVSALSLRR
ncbi:hypothetical protein EVAR_66137_1 [Eumeta japonica]|uniref:Uncharacterized protein n=1 Tax=Eumeta variegata TaxID=151549 RepID=A0A4C1YWB4_EUMVA|nr:hypothetical protein EVAR_66137_1 [Eumeta japonica]